MVMRNYRQQNSVLTGDDYASLQAVNPEQVYLYAGAYGSDGPYTTRPAFAPTMGVAAGHRAYQLGWPSAINHLEDITFEEGMERLRAQRTNSGGPTANADAAAAMIVGSAMLLGLVARQRNGVGQYLETSMLCANAYVVSDDFFDFAGKAVVAHHDENGVNARYRLYPASQGWVFLAAPLAADWVGLAAALHDGTDGAVDLAADARFATPTAREERDAELAEVIAGAALESRTRPDWEARFAAHDVALVEVSQGSFSEFTISSEVMRENDFVAEVTHPRFGTHLRHGPIVTFSETPGSPRPACLVGQHTRAMLQELGYSDEQAADLRAAGHRRLARRRGNGLIQRGRGGRLRRGLSDGGGLRSGTDSPLSTRTSNRAFRAAASALRPENVTCTDRLAAASFSNRGTHGSRSRSWYSYEKRSSPVSTPRSQASALRPWKRTNAVSVVATVSGGSELSKFGGTSTPTKDS